MLFSETLRRPCSPCSRGEFSLRSLSPYMNRYSKNGCKSKAKSCHVICVVWVLWHVDNEFVKNLRHVFYLIMYAVSFLQRLTWTIYPFFLHFFFVFCVSSRNYNIIMPSSESVLLLTFSLGEFEMWPLFGVNCWHQCHHFHQWESLNYYYFYSK